MVFIIRRLMQKRDGGICLYFLRGTGWPATGSEDLDLKRYRPLILYLAIQYYADSMLTIPGAGALYSLRDQRFEDTETGRAQTSGNEIPEILPLVLIFHSWRPVVDDPELGMLL